MKGTRREGLGLCLITLGILIALITFDPPILYLAMVALPLNVALSAYWIRQSSRH